MSMLTMEARGRYKIGIYTLTMIGRGNCSRWAAEACGGALGNHYEEFPSIYAAYLKLTGEPLSPSQLRKARKERLS